MCELMCNDKAELIIIFCIEYELFSESNMPSLKMEYLMTVWSRKDRNSIGVTFRKRELESLAENIYTQLERFISSLVEYSRKFCILRELYV